MNFAVESKIGSQEARWSGMQKSKYQEMKSEGWKARKQGNLENDRDERMNFAVESMIGSKETRRSGVQKSK